MSAPAPATEPPPRIVLLGYVIDTLRGVSGAWDVLSGEERSIVMDFLRQEEPETLSELRELGHHLAKL